MLEIGVLRRSNFDYSCFLVGFFFLSFFWGVVVLIGSPPSLRDWRYVHFPGDMFPGFYCQVKEYVTFGRSTVLAMSHTSDVCLKHPLPRSRCLWSGKWGEVTPECSVHAHLGVNANKHPLVTQVVELVLFGWALPPLLWMGSQRTERGSHRAGLWHRTDTSSSPGLPVTGVTHGVGSSLNFRVLICRIAMRRPDSQGSSRRCHFS